MREKLKLKLKEEAVMVNLVWRKATPIFHRLRNFPQS
jgi:hypothetical protein